MSIILGIIVPALLFLITLPLQSFLFLLRNHLKVLEKQERRGKGSLGSKLGLSRGSDKLRSELGLKPKSNISKKVSSKMKIASLKAMRLAIRAVSMLISLLRTVASTLIVLVITAVMMVLPVCLAVILATSSIIMFYNSNTSNSSEVSSVAVTNKDSNNSSNNGGNVKVSNIRYNQMSYGGTKINRSTPLSSGCGWCSLTHMMINLNPEKCGKMSPVDWISVMPDSVKNCWCDSMGWNAPDEWVKALNSMDKYGKYKLVMSDKSGVVSDTHTKEILEVLKRYMKDDSTQVIVSTSTGLFTGGGHIILVNNVTSDGKYFSITDSSSKASGRLGFASKINGHFYNGKFNFYKFPTDKVSLKGYKYNMKCCWVIKREK